jgi:uncharacterized protein YhaN
MVPTGNLVDLGDGGEQTIAHGSTSASGSPSRLTTDGASSPILPSILELCSGFGDSFDFCLAGRLFQDDIRAESTAIFTSGLTNPSKPQGHNDEVVTSPTRTLFPSISHGPQKAEQTAVSPSSISLAKAASLRHRNQELEEECNNWRKKYDELQTKYDELEKKYKDREEDVANRMAAGADW